MQYVLAKSVRKFWTTNVDISIQSGTNQIQKKRVECELNGNCIYYSDRALSVLAANMAIALCTERFQFNGGEKRSELHLS